MLPQTLQVQFLGAITKQQPFMIITEYMTGGSLLDLFKSKVVLSPWRSVQVALDCARGMAYLHNRTPNAVVHRDLKPANIMLGGPKVYTPFHKTVLLVSVGGGVKGGVGEGGVHRWGREGRATSL